MATEKDQEIISEIKAKSKELYDLYGQEYDRQVCDLKFATGDQWEEDDHRRFTDDAYPMATHNFIAPYIDRIVNPYIMSPIKQVVSGTQADELINAFINKFERDSNLQEAIQTAHRTQVTCGRGYVHLCTEYEDDETNAVVIDVDPVSDPTMMFLGPHDKIDGSDAEYGVAIKWVDKDVALEKTDKEGAVDDAVNVWEHWQRPNNTVAEVLYYNMDKTSFTRSFMADGSVVDEDIPEEMQDQVMATRKITRKAVKMTHVIGDTVISTATYDIDAIPIVPIYGKLKYCDEGIEYSGVVEAMKDSQRKVNISSSIELQLIEDAPKAPWLLSTGQIGNNPKLQAQWRTAGSKRYDALIYETETVDGKPVPKPERVNNEAQTVAVTNTKTQATQDLARETGIFDGAFGETAGQGVEAMGTVLTRSKQQELMTASYTDNLMRSIKQIYKVALQLMSQLYDTPKNITTVDEQGNKVPQDVVFADVPINFKQIDFELSSAPSLESRRAESITTLQGIMQIYPPAAPLIAVRIAENMNVPNKDALVEDMKKLLPPELQDKSEEAPDPEALEVMQNAQNTIAQLEEQVSVYEGYVNQLQSAILDDDKDRANKISIEQIKAQVDIAKIEADMTMSRMKIEADLAKSETKADVDLLKISQDFEKKILDIMSKVTADTEKADVDIEIEDEQPEQIDMFPLVEGPMASEAPDVGADDVIEELNFEEGEEQR